MRKETVYEIASSYRDAFKIRGYYFGSGQKSVCIMGSLRGDEIQQMYICSQLVKKLKELEADGRICADKEILVIPLGNPYSMNVAKRFWPIDNTDINRMFPGYDGGETTQRIAAALFKQAEHYGLGIQLSSFYMPGEFIPHVKVMKTDYQRIESAYDFGLPYVVLRQPKPFDMVTLNYNWQLWGTEAFSLYTSVTDRIDEATAMQAVKAILNFLVVRGVVKGTSAARKAAAINEEELVLLNTKKAGIYRRFKFPGDKVRAGEVLSEVLNPYEGTVEEEIRASQDGTIFFSYAKPLVSSQALVYKLISE